LLSSEAIITGKPILCPDKFGVTANWDNKVLEMMQQSVPIYRYRE
jgi:hypothetical protein